MKLRFPIMAWACAAALSACGDNAPNTPPAATTVPPPAATKTYKVVSESVKPPLVTYVEGKPTGFEYEVLQAIAEKQGIDFVFETVPVRERLLSTVEQGKADLAIGAITINDERKQKLDFSEPVLDYTTAVLVAKDLVGVKSFAELRGKRVASRKGTVYEKMALNELADAKGENIRYYDTAWLQVKSVLNGTEEVVLGDSHILEYYVQQHGKDNVAFVQGMTFPKESYGFAVKKGNTELQKQLNDGLAAIKADGTYGKIYQTYWKK